MSEPNVAKQFWVDKAVDEAACILDRIDRKWPLAVVIGPLA
jgi:hypothetical protein